MSSSSWWYVFGALFWLAGCSWSCPVCLWHSPLPALPVVPLWPLAQTIEKSQSNVFNFVRHGQITVREKKILVEEMLRRGEERHLVLAAGCRVTCCLSSSPHCSLLLSSTPELFTSTAYTTGTCVLCGFMCVFCFQVFSCTLMQMCVCVCRSCL